MKQPVKSLPKSVKKAYFIKSLITFINTIIKEMSHKKNTNYFFN